MKFLFKSGYLEPAGTIQSQMGTKVDTYQLSLRGSLAAAQSIDKIGEPMRTRIKERLAELKEDLEKKGGRLRHTEFWRLRIGDYRSIYEIKREKRQIIVLYVGHRRDVYNDFSRIY